MNTNRASVPPRPSRAPASAIGRGNPGTWRRELAVGLISGIVVALGSLSGQALVDDQRSTRESAAAQLSADEADRRENLRFVRERSDDVANKPFGSMDLVGQNLVGLRLPNANFDNAKLSETKFYQAILTDSTLKFSEAIKANFSMADLSRSNFESADLTGAYFGAAKLIDTNLMGADLPSANFEVADLRGAVMVKANLAGAIFGNANLTESTFQQADLRGANFTHAKLGRAGLYGANLTDAVLEGVDWDYSAGNGIPQITACYDAETIWPAGFVPPAVNERVCGQLVQSERRN